MKLKHLDLPPNNHGEGLIWIEKTNELAWVDVFEDPGVRVLNLNSKELKTISVSGPITSIAPHLSGGFVAGMNGGFYLISYYNDPVHLASPKGMHKNELLNDGRCDSRGRYLCSSMDMGMKDEIGKIYQVSSDGKIKILDENFIVGNGIVFSPQEDIVYISDSRKDIIWKYDYNILNGAISNKRLFFSTAELRGRPDGAAIDAHGNYWSCLFEGGSVVCIDHITEQIRKKIPLPVTYPTMCTFGGQKLDRLYVTTSKRLLSGLELRKQPMAGKILEISNLGVAGFNSAKYSA
jgi:L-arabinonolactonase